MANPRIIVLTAPSGAGKTTIAHRLLPLFPGMSFSISATTRPKRGKERDGIDYHFLSIKAFHRLRATNQLAEYQEVYPGAYYGTLQTELMDASREQPLLLDIDVKGALTLKKRYPEYTLAIFLRPPSLETLKRRLQTRATETEKSLRERLARAEEELSYADRYDASVTNDDLEQATQDIALLVQQFLARP